MASLASRIGQLRRAGHSPQAISALLGITPAEVVAVSRNPSAVVPLTPVGHVLHTSDEVDLYEEEYNAEGFPLLQAGTVELELHRPCWVHAKAEFKVVDADDVAELHIGLAPSTEQLTWEWTDRDLTILCQNKDEWGAALTPGVWTPAPPMEILTVIPRGGRTIAVPWVNIRHANLAQPVSAPVQIRNFSMSLLMI